MFASRANTMSMLKLFTPTPPRMVFWEYLKTRPAQPATMQHESYQQRCAFPMENAAKSTQFATSGESKCAVIVTGAS